MQVLRFQVEVKEGKELLFFDLKLYIYWTDHRLEGYPKQDVPAEIWRPEFLCDAGAGVDLGGAERYELLPTFALKDNRNGELQMIVSLSLQRDLGENLERMRAFPFDGTRVNMMVVVGGEKRCEGTKDISVSWSKTAWAQRSWGDEAGGVEDEEDEEVEQGDGINAPEKGPAKSNSQSLDSKKRGGYITIKKLLAVLQGQAAAKGLSAQEKLQRRRSAALMERAVRHVFGRVVVPRQQAVKFLESAAETVWRELVESRAEVGENSPPADLFTGVTRSEFEEQLSFAEGALHSLADEDLRKRSDSRKGFGEETPAGAAVADETEHVNHFATWQIRSHHGEYKLHAFSYGIANHMSPQTNVTYWDLLFSLHLSRVPNFYVIKGIAPLYVCACFGLMTYFVEPDDLGTRLALLFALFLTCFAIQWVVVERLPNLPFLTILDEVAFFSVLFLFAIAGTQCCVYRLTRFSVLLDESAAVGAGSLSDEMQKLARTVVFFDKEKAQVLDVLFGGGLFLGFLVGCVGWRLFWRISTLRRNSGLWSRLSEDPKFQFGTMTRECFRFDVLDFEKRGGDQMEATLKGLMGNRVVPAMEF